MVRAAQPSGSSFLSALFLVMIVVYPKASAIYKETGKSVTFRPISGTSGINDVEWKYGKDLAADWYESTSITTCYGQFKDRCEVDLSTGALTITELISEDAGLFSVRINDQKDGQFELKVISSVAKPSINVSCDAERTYCLLTCEGETSDAQPITYGWPGVDGHTDMVLRITKDMKIETFSCVMENPVSNKSSDSIPNPFTENQTTADMTAVWVSLVVVLVLVAVGVTAYVIYKRRCGTDRGSYAMVPPKDKSNHVADDIELPQQPTGNHTHSNGDASGGVANHSSSPVRTQNGPQRPDAAHVAGNLPQNPPVSAPQGAGREDGVANGQVENPLQNPPAPASQDAAKQDDIAVEIDNHDQVIQVPASQDTPERGGVADEEVGNPLQNPPAPASQDAAKQDEISVVVEIHNESLPAPASGDSTEQGVANGEVENPLQNPPAPASQDATKKDEISVVVEIHDESLPAPASGDSTEQANGEVENPLQNPPAPASQDAAKKDDIGVEIDNHDQVIQVPASQDTQERGGVADEEVGNPPQNPPAPASQDATEEDETLH